MVTTPKPRPVLTIKQARFVDEYMIDLNGTQAAIRAGYSARTAGPGAGQLLKNIKILEAISERVTFRSVSSDIMRERVLREYAATGFANMSDFAEWDNDGLKLTPSDELTRDQISAVSDISMDEHSVRDREGNTITNRKVKFKLANKQAALDSLAKHLGMFIERTEITGAGGGPIQVSIAESFGVVVEGSVVSDSKELLEG